MSASASAASSSAAAPASAVESPSGYLSLALHLAHLAGQSLYSTLQIHPNDRGISPFSTKSTSADVVTLCDQHCEQIIFSGIKQIYPLHHLLGEESHSTEGIYPNLPKGRNEIQWIVDPIDGTNNFIHGLPNVAVSIAVVKGAEVIVGVIHRPALGETVYAVKCQGSFRIEIAASYEGQPIPASSAPTPVRVSQITQLSRACVATEMGYSRFPALCELMTSKLRDLLTKGQTQSIRMHGSCCCNLIDIALGKIDAYFEGINTTTGPKPWDVAAGSLIVKEAGGFVCDISDGGSSSSNTSSSNGNSNITIQRPFSIWNGRILAGSNQQLCSSIAKILNETTTEWQMNQTTEMKEKVEYKPNAGMTNIPVAPLSNNSTNNVTATATTQSSKL